MNCPYCNTTDTKVTDSRHLVEINKIKRRRKCESCNQRFSTHETVYLTMPVIVKNDGRREAFERRKIEKGLKHACQKRPIPANTIEQIIDNIERAVWEHGEKEFKSKNIGEIVIEQLRSLDLVAYVRFASVYFTYDDISEFTNNLKLSYKNSQNNHPQGLYQDNNANK